MRCLLMLALFVSASWCGSIPVQADEESDKAAVLASWQEWSDSFITLRIRGRLRSRIQLRERFPDISALSDEEIDQAFYREYELIQSTSGDFRLGNREMLHSVLVKASMRGRNQRDGFICQYTPQANGELKLATVSTITIELAGFAEKVIFFWDDGPTGGEGHWLQRQILESPSSLRVKAPDGHGPPNCIRAEVIAEPVAGHRMIYDLWLDPENQHFPVRIEKDWLGKRTGGSIWEVTDLARHPMSKTVYPQRGVLRSEVDMTHHYDWEILDFETNFDVVDQFRPPKPETGTIVYDRDGKTRGDGVSEDGERRTIITDAKSAVQEDIATKNPVQASPRNDLAWWPIAAAAVAAIVAGLVLRGVRSQG
jgi:hypothetical protein